HSPGMSVYQPEPAKMRAEAAPKGKAIADIRLDKTNYEEAMKAFAKAAELSPFVRWDKLSEMGIEKDAEVSVAVKNASLERVFELLNEGRTGDMLDYRVHDGLLEVASQHYFDKREAELVSFDIK